MNVYKKVWNYVKKYKKLLVICLCSMLVCQALLLVSPLIVKEILDNHLVGVEDPWFEVKDNNDKYTITYNAKNYKQKKYIDDNDILIENGGISIFQLNGNYYYVDEIIVFGNKDIKGDTVTVTDTSNNVYTYPISKLKVGEIRTFYSPSVDALKILVVLLFLRLLFSIIFTYIQRITASMININIVRDARLEAVTALESLPITYYESEPAGKIANRIIFDADGIMGLFSTFINLVMNATLSVIFAYAGMFILDPKLALITFLAFPIIYIWMKYFNKFLNKIATKVNELSSLITASVNEIINGISILQIFNYKKQTADNFDKLSKEFMDEQLKEVKLHLSLGWNMISLLRGIVTACVILYFGLGYLSIPGMVISAGIIYAYNEYLIRLIEPINILFRQLSGFEHAKVKTGRMLKLIESEKEDYSLSVIPRAKGDIKFEDVWFQYNPNNFVLKGVSLHIKPGEMVGVVGHTGSGKSTLMSLLLRFYDIKDIDLGKILVDDEDITTYSKRTYRSNVGIILQEPILFRGTIADNIRFGLNDISDEAIEKVLRDIGGGKIIDKLENGINQDVTRAGGNFSVGEKQIISFARAMVHDKPILVMDEATANIDTETESMIQKCLEVVKENRTLIVIAHRLSTIKNADKIVVLQAGEKVEEGSHQELLRQDGVYANIYRSQVKISQ